jgi:hypothetical protein
MFDISLSRLLITSNLILYRQTQYSFYILLY